MARALGLQLQREDTRRRRDLLNGEPGPVWQQRRDPVGHGTLAHHGVGARTTQGAALPQAGDLEGHAGLPGVAVAGR
ncbi:MAG: hypothetical protein ACK5QX_12475 [bacterium]